MSGNDETPPPPEGTTSHTEHETIIGVPSNAEAISHSVLIGVDAKAVDNPRGEALASFDDPLAESAEGVIRFRNGTARAERPALTSSRGENVEYDELTIEEVEAMFATQKPDAKPAGVTSVMDESDMERLLNSLGDKDGYEWLPAWARSPTPVPAKTYTPEDVYEDAPDDVSSGDETLQEVKSLICDMEVSVASIDDATTATRDLMRSAVEDVQTMQSQLGNIEDDVGTLKAQNAALFEEVRELHAATMMLRGMMAALLRAVDGKGPSRAYDQALGRDRRKASHADLPDDPPPLVDARPASDA